MERVCVDGDAPMMETMVAGDLWEQALQRIQSNLPSQTYDTWFRSLGPLEFDGSTLVLEAPSQST